MQNYQENISPETPAPPIKEDFTPTSDLLPASPDNPPWKSPAAIGVWLASVAFIAVVPLFLLLPYVLSKGGFSDAPEMLQNDSTAILLSIVGVIPAHILTLVLAWFVVTGFKKKYEFRRMLGWEWNGFNIWTCLIIIGGFFALAGIGSYYFPERENDFLRILKSSREAVFIIAFMATFTAPLVEEVVYRGVLYSAFQRAVGVPAAVALVTILFALVHVPQYFPSYLTIFLLCLLSLILTLIRASTKNLLPCIALHTVFNGTQSLLLIFQPYLEKAVESNQPPAAFFIHLIKSGIFHF